MLLVQLGEVPLGSFVSVIGPGLCPEWRVEGAVLGSIIRGTTSNLVGCKVYLVLTHKNVWTHVGNGPL